MRPFWIMGAASLWMATLGNLALWQELQKMGLMNQPQGWLLAAGLAGITAGATGALLGLLAWRWTFRLWTSVLLLAAALGAYYMLTYRVVIDSTMIVNVLQTNTREALDVMSLRMLLEVGILGILPVFLVWRLPVRYAPPMRQLIHNALWIVGGLAVVVASAVLCFQPLASTMRNHKHVRYLINPLNSVYAVGYLATTPLRRNPRELLPLGQDAQLGATHAGQSPPPLLVLVLGETARSMNFGINGYARDTTPRLASEKVVSFRNAWSCGTSTAASVPCMFSHLGRKNFDNRPANYETVLDVLYRSGLAVLWVDNQAGCKGVCARVASANTYDRQHPTLCATGECLDGIMLEGLDARIAALPAERRAKGVVVVLHQMGSHGPAYYKRSPPELKKFQPECKSNNLQDCPREHLVNAYDNTIAYTDHFLGQTIDWLKRQQSAWAPAMMYVSDHGESLGENNLYLHGLPYSIAPDVQKRVPWVSWFSTGFTERLALDLSCLDGRRDAEISHDNYFHSVLGLMDVQTSVYQKPLDVYAPCRRTVRP